MAVRLDQKDIEFVQAAGLAKTREATYHFVRTKLASCKPITEKNHPVLKAMTAIGAADAEGLKRNFDMECGKLSEAEIDSLVENILGWIRGEIQASGKVQSKIGEF